MSADETPEIERPETDEPEAVSTRCVRPVVPRRPSPEYRTPARVQQIIAAAELYASSRAFNGHLLALNTLVQRLDAMGDASVLGAEATAHLKRAVARSTEAKQALDGAAHQARMHLEPDADALPPLPSVKRVHPPETFRKTFAASAAHDVDPANLFTLLAGVWAHSPAPDRWLYADHLAIEIADHDRTLAEPLIVAAYLAKPTPERALRAANQLFKFGTVTAASHFLALAGPDHPVSAPIGELRLAQKLLHIGIDLATSRRDEHGPAVDDLGTDDLAIDDLAYVASSSLPYSTAGYTVRTHALLRAYRALGYKVTCYTRPGFPWDRPLLPGASEATTESVVDDIRYVHSDVADIRHDPERLIERMAEVLRQQFVARRPRIVQAASNSRNALPALMAARSLGIPFVYEVRGLWDLTSASTRPGWERTERFELQQGLEGLIAREADHVFAITGGVADELAALGVDPGRISLLPNGVEPDDFPPRPRDFALLQGLSLGLADLTIAYAGSLLAYEGLDDVMRAIHRLATQGRRVNFIVVGDGAARAGLEDLVQALDLAASVRFVGRVEPHAVAAFMDLADVVVITRKPERVCEIVSPLKPFEALAQGRLVIVSNLAALTEIVPDHERGRVCEPANPESLAKVLSEVIEAPDYHRLLAEKGRDWVVANCSWRHLAASSRAVHATIV